MKVGFEMGLKNIEKIQKTHVKQGKDSRRIELLEKRQEFKELHGGSKEDGWQCGWMVCGLLVGGMWLP